MLKRIEKILDGNCIKMQHVVLNKSWKGTPNKTVAVLPLISHLTNYPNKTNKTCWALLEMDELISNVLLWTPTHGCISFGWPAKTYIHQLCWDTGCSLEDLPGATDDRDGQQKRELVNSMLSVQLADDSTI